VIEHKLATIDEHRTSSTQVVKGTAPSLAPESIEFDRQDVVGEREGLHCVDTKRPATTIAQHAQNLVRAHPVISVTWTCRPRLPEPHNNTTSRRTVTPELENTLRHQTESAGESCGPA